MGNIVLLDELTINKIAAGEVIERPASVIKEMVENSIDAGATNITVEIKNGGISYIRITDNGKGIQKDDLEIAFERHATSKIRHADDLNYIKSMGFRGEALASIAAISNIELYSKTEEDEVGSRIIVEGGNVLEQGEYACPKGTTITVRNLFYNTPVRYKFLKKDYTESGYIEDVITRLALINTKIAFKLINTGKTVIQTNGDGNINNVIFNIYGKDIAKAVIPVEYEYEDIKITGVIGKPEISRSNRGNQIFFINNRYVKDKVLSSASEKAFKGILPIGKYGFTILNVQIEPSTVDVNVHPAKLEVRFQDESKIFKAVYNAIKDTLLKAQIIQSIPEEDKKVEYTTPSNKMDFSDMLKNWSKKEDKLENNFQIPIINTAPTMTIEDVVSEKIEKERLEQQKQENKIENEQKAEEISNTNEIIPNNKVESENIIESVFLSKNKEKEFINEKNDIDKTIIMGKIVEDKEEKEEAINKANEVNEKINIEPQEEVVSEKTIPINDIKNEQTHAENEVIEKEDIKAGDLVTKLIENKINPEDYTKKIDLTPKPNFKDMYSRIFGKANKSEEKQEDINRIYTASDIINENISLYEENEEYNGDIRKNNYKLIGIAFEEYIIIEIEKELYIINRLSANEKIVYEKLKENYYSDESKDSQLLLLPDIIKVTYKEMAIVRDNLDKFEKAGFRLEEFGDNAIKLTGAPTMCVNLNTEDLFLEILNEINTVARTDKEEIEKKFLETIAIKTAMKEMNDLTEEEAVNIVEKLLILENPFVSDNGKPVAIKITKADLEKKFARRK